MKARLCWMGLLLVFSITQAYAERVHHKKKEADCTTYSGTRAELPDADAKFLQQAVSIFRDKKRMELLSLLDSRTLLIRRFGFSASARGGNLRFELKPEQIDKDFNVRVGKMTLPEYRGNGEVEHGEQLLQEFGFFAPSVQNTAVFLNRRICDGAGECDVVPKFDGVENLLGGLLSCSNHGNTVFVFTDGILLVDMRDAPGAGLDNGEALYFSRTAAGYKLSAMISLQ